MNVCLFDDDNRGHLFPFTVLRPVSSLRVGILTIAEKWERFFSHSVCYSVPDYLQIKFTSPLSGETLYINGTVCPDEKLFAAIQQLAPEQSLVQQDVLIAVRSKHTWQTTSVAKISYTHSIVYIRRVWEILTHLEHQLRADFSLLTKNKVSQKILDPHTRVYGNNLFVDENVSIKAAIINSEEGVVYLGKNVKVEEGAVIRGPFAALDHAEIKANAVMRGNTVLGPYCKAGGEVSHSVMQGFSNKAHDGFLGHSVIGEWCNLGAGTTNSNLKNNYSNVKLWNNAVRNYEDTGLTFCGAFVGDHTKTGIQTTLNTGTISGVHGNLFGTALPPKFIPSFSWGEANAYSTYEFEKCIETARAVMKRRHQTFSESDKKVLEAVYSMG